MPRKGGIPENLTPWKPGQTGNPGGRKPLLVRTMLKELEAIGYERVTRDQIISTFEYLMTLDHDKVKEFISGAHVPIFVRLVGQRLLTKDGFEAIETMLDRAHGKARQELTGKDGAALMAGSIQLVMPTGMDIQLPNNTDGDTGTVQGTD